MRDRRTLIVLSMGLAAVASPWRLNASELVVSIVDREHQPVPHVAVFAVPAERSAMPGPTTQAVMGQRDHAFVPHILVVQTGTLIEFPNTDTVSHHVYSFSDAKRFELPLYRGDVHPPLMFDRPGIVTLGCNIHDGMLGYILVVDTPYFMLSDDNGRAQLDALPAGKYVTYAWTPRLRENRLPDPQTVTVGDGAPTEILFAFDSKLYPPHDQHEGSLSWWDY